MSTPTIGLSPTATSAPASRKTSIAAATTSGCVTIPEPGAATRPTFGFSSTRFPRTGERSTPCQRPASVGVGPIAVCHVHRRIRRRADKRVVGEHFRRRPDCQEHRLCLCDRNLPSPFLPSSRIPMMNVALSIVRETSVVFRSAKETSFRGAKGDTLTIISRTMLRGPPHRLWASLSPSERPSRALSLALRVPVVFSRMRHHVAEDVPVHSGGPRAPSVWMSSRCVSSGSREAGYVSSSLVDLAMGPLEDGRRTLLLPALAPGTVDDGAGEPDLRLPVTPRMIGDQQVPLAQQLLQQRPRGEILLRLDARHQPQGHAAHARCPRPVFPGSGSFRSRSCPVRKCC